MLHILKIGNFNFVEETKFFIKNKLKDMIKLIKKRNIHCLIFYDISILFYYKVYK